MRMGDGVKGLCLVLRWEKLQHVGDSPQTNNLEVGERKDT